MVIIVNDNKVTRYPNGIPELVPELKNMTLNDLTPSAQIEWGNGAQHYYGHRDCDIRDWVIAKVKNMTKNQFKGCQTKKCGLNEGQRCPKHGCDRVMTVDYFMEMFNLTEKDIDE